MIGFDKDWILSAAGEQSETYTNLDPGVYLFKVKVKTGDGVWAENEATLKIIITPPYWATWWAYIFYILFVSSLVYLYIFIRTNNQKKELNVLRKADKLKSEFLAQMSHEIRTPINVIMEYIQYINDSYGHQMDIEAQSCFDSINLASRRIIRTIDLILNMSELQTGNYEPVFIKIDLNSQVLQYLFYELQRKAKEKGIELIYKSDIVEAEILADEYSIIQTFANLIDNAIKYTKIGKVEIHLGKNGSGNIMVEIKDTGIGISKEFQARIFEPFMQEEQGYTRSYEGNGLGLALVKKYCDLNNASIEIESEKNVGSTFRVTFKN
jgi:signal transduction histidine kinase